MNTLSEMSSKFTLSWPGVPSNFLVPLRSQGPSETHASEEFPSPYRTTTVFRLHILSVTDEVPTHETILQAKQLRLCGSLLSCLLLQGHEQYSLPCLQGGLLPLRSYILPLILMSLK